MTRCVNLCWGWHPLDNFYGWSALKKCIADRGESSKANLYSLTAYAAAMFQLYCKVTTAEAYPKCLYAILFQWYHKQASNPLLRLWHFQHRIVGKITTSEEGWRFIRITRYNNERAGTKWSGPWNPKGYSMWTISWLQGPFNGMLNNTIFPIG